MWIEDHDDDGDFLNRLLLRSREFQELVQQRDAEKLRGVTISYDDIRRELLGETT